jgi:hypothetical protein
MSYNEPVPLLGSVNHGLQVFRDARHAAKKALGAQLR